ncbi:molecular chaperone DnaK (HSP70) [Methylohalomonas lacus]|uniref:Molecular chaperone DnaK (HSP70) n=1 Tax=Methylohalomonas lacus TaxID=398773 RepID=A0AAE3HIH6_9GAMM|nr:DUF4124 domain-containing protein [Methylohalomonas lacus]MCS3902955.1 molecular chaperone DnaK (HSP70) [Methylohalomonas lacus]
MYRVQTVIPSILALLMLNTPVLATNMYKWTDEEGNVHYTQNPPPEDAQGVRMDPPADVDTEQAREELQRKQEKLEAMEQQREQAREEAEKEQERAALYEKNCRLARERLQRLENSGMVRAIDEDGNMSRIGPEEQAERINEVKEKVKKYCES